MGMRFKHRKMAIREMMTTQAAQDLVRKEGERYLQDVKSAVTLSRGDVPEKVYKRDFGGGSGKSLEQLVDEGYRMKFSADRDRPRAQVGATNPASAADNARHDTLFRSL